MSIKKAVAAAAGKIVKSPAGQAVAAAEVATATDIAKAVGREDLVPGIEEAGKKLTGNTDTNSGSGS